MYILNTYKIQNVIIFLDKAQVLFNLTGYMEQTRVYWLHLTHRRG